MRPRDLIEAAFDSHLAGGLLVTHDPADAFALADRVMVLENGEVSQFNSLNVLSTQPATPPLHSGVPVALPDHAHVGRGVSGDLFS